MRHESAGHRGLGIRGLERRRGPDPARRRRPRARPRRARRHGPGCRRPLRRGQAPDAIVQAAIWNAFAGLLSRPPARRGRASCRATRHVVDAANARGRARRPGVHRLGLRRHAGPAAEDEPPNPINTYGFLKAASELRRDTSAAERGAVARIAGVQGIHRAARRRSAQQDAGFGYLVASVVDALRRGRPLHGLGRPGPEHDSPRRCSPPTPRS